MTDFPLPVIGFAAYSGTGKTTLLSRVIPLLKQTGLRIGVLKHAHHHFDIDHFGKDSHTLRESGASQVLVASKHRWAMITEMLEQQDEPPMDELIHKLDSSTLDLVLIEGYKSVAFPKIELHREALGKPYLHHEDANIIAIASDHPVENTSLPVLDINNIEEIARFIIQHFSLGTVQPNQTAIG